MNADFSPEDIAEIRKQGDLSSLFAALIGKPDPQAKTSVEDDEPEYHIARPGAWPCGTSATGPVPGPCCPQCAPPEGDRHLHSVPTTDRRAA